MVEEIPQRTGVWALMQEAWVQSLARDFIAVIIDIAASGVTFVLALGTVPNSTKD